MSRESLVGKSMRKLAAKWVTRFRPAMKDDNAYDRGEVAVDGKDLAEIGEDFAHIIELSHAVDRGLIPQAGITIWHRETFPDATDQSIMTHMREEIEELDDAIAGGKRAEIGEEIADMVMLLIGIAGNHDITVAEEVRRKFGEIRDAEWYDAPGGYRKRAK